MKNEDIFVFVKKMGLFLVGFLGLSIISAIVQLAFGELIVSAMGDQASAFLNFIVYFIGAIILCLIVWKNELINIFKGFKVPQNIKDGIAIGVIILAVTMSYNLLLSLITPSFGSNDNEASVDNMILINPVLSFITVVLLAPLVEEITYRYGLFAGIRKYSRVLAYIVTSLVFALIHFDFNFTDQAVLINELLNLPTYIFAAVMLCYAYDKNSALATSMTAHLINNLTAVITTIIASFLQ